MKSSDNTGMGSKIKVQEIAVDFHPQSEIVIVLVFLIIYSERNMDVPKQPLETS